MAGADAAIEAIVEKVGPKKEAFATLDGILSPDTLFLTNTSSISITDLASATNRPDKVCGTHFFTPPPVREAVEVGAAGVVHKSTVMDEVIEAVRRVRAGETLLPLDEVVELLRFAGLQREQEQKARQAIAQLTPREKEVLQALAEGLDSK
jgi:3-hydroxybutyryl-CoA dehydrogenase